ncbi:uncharacterized protein LOC132194845 [Neocloeon triangulifer]|uniref:uncharacterized protein LOC132194845 n=1 Tax=Neocloeon triangulifer TaxID=2078957 RepID=UPI00286EC98A|nr:uncharacterized protein LOC132194845 [Neocloeon triangulifer]
MAKTEITVIDRNESDGNSSDATNNNNNNNDDVSASQKKRSTKFVDVDAFLEEAAQAPADCGSPMELPPWFDLEKFKRGQEFMRRNIFTFLYSKLSGLMCLLAVPSILRVLSCTSQSSEPCSAFNRYFSTLSHMMEWYDGDLLEPGSKAYQSLKLIRSRHSAAAKRSRKLGLMSQFDMIVTQFGFIGFAILHPKFFALHREKQEAWEGIAHFWRTVGYLLGIEDRFNLCTGSLEETKSLCLAIEEKVVAPGLRNPPSHFEPMATALITGMQCLIPSLDFHMMMAVIMEDFLGSTYEQKMSLRSKCGVLEVRLVFYQLLARQWLATVFRPFFNGLVRLALFIAARFPFIAYWRYGKKSVHFH